MSPIRMKVVNFREAAMARFETDWEEWRARQRETFLAFGATAAGAEIEVERAERRARARSDWARSRMAEWRAAVKRCDEAWMKLVEAHPDDEDFDDPPEQAEFDRIHDEIWNVVEHDRWPRHLHWGGI